jgi:hypothetical protein
MQLATQVYSQAEMLAIMLPFNRGSSWLVGDLMRTDAYHKAGGIEQAGVHYTSDFGLALRLLELGRGAYINTVFGKHRAWGATEGKVDSQRFVASVKDHLELYKMVDERTALRDLAAACGPDALRRARKNKARMLLLGLGEAIAIGEIHHSEVSEVGKAILKIHDGRLERTLLAATQPALVRVFLKALPFARKAYRAVGLDKRLNRRGLERE